jgi:hypothetical protein
MCSPNAICSCNTPESRRQPLTCYRLQFTETIKVLVGGHPGTFQQEFIVHHDIILKRSWFFSECERCKTEDSPQMVLYEYAPETFDKYLHCLYFNKVPEYIQSPTEDEETACLEQQAESKFKSLIALYSLAHGLNDPVTENLVVDEIKPFGQQDRTPGPKIIELAYSCVRSNSKLLNLLADLYILNKNAKHKGDYPKAFLDLMVKKFLHWKCSGGIVIDVRLAAKVKNNHQWASDKYHQHLQ